VILESMPIWLYKNIMSNHWTLLLALALAVAPAALPAQQLRLPGVLQVADLAATQPNRVLLDLRAEWEWNDYRVPGSQRVALDQLLAMVAKLPAEQEVVLLSKDGEVAFAAAGALLERQPERRVHVLRGGVAQYYRDRVLASARTTPAGKSPLPTPSTGTPAAKPTTTKRNVGC